MTPNLDILVSHFFTVARMMKEQIHQGKDCDSFSFLEFKTLMIISEKKNPSMREIAAELNITSPSATQVMNQLAKKGGIIREPDRLDRRIIRLRITPQGAKDLRKWKKQASEKVKKMLLTLSEKEKENLTHILTHIITHHNESIA